MARKRLRELRDGMSEKEQRRLHDCWREPEFQKLFNDYTEEVSDPKHRAETEQYLAQCEAEQRAERLAAQGLGVASLDSALPKVIPGRPDGPAGSQLLKPHKGFVVKTYKRSPGRTDFDRVRPAQRPGTPAHITQPSIQSHPCPFCTTAKTSRADGFASTGTVGIVSHPIISHTIHSTPIQTNGIHLSPPLYCPDRHHTVSHLAPPPNHIPATPSLTSPHHPTTPPPQLM